MRNGNGENACKSSKGWLPACCPSLTMFSKGSFLKTSNIIIVLTHYQTTNFRLFQIERVCRQNFKFDENGRKLAKRVENTVGKGEIACYEQFLLFPQFFQKACFPGVSKGAIVWEWVKGLLMQTTNKIFLN